MMKWDCISKVSWGFRLLKYENNVLQSYMQSYIMYEGLWNHIHNQIWYFHTILMVLSKEMVLEQMEWIAQHLGGALKSSHLKLNVYKGEQATMPGQHTRAPAPKTKSTLSLGWALEESRTRPSFFLYFREVRNKRSHWPGGQSAPRLYNRYNLCPCARPAHVGECGPGPEFKFSKTVEVGWSC